MHVSWSFDWSCQFWIVPSRSNISKLVPLATRKFQVVLKIVDFFAGTREVTNHSIHHAAHSRKELASLRHYFLQRLNTVHGGR